MKMLIFLLVLVVLNSLELFIDMPIWYTVVMGIVTIIAAIVVIKNSRILKKLRNKRN